jgi:hypothetical protein
MRKVPNASSSNMDYLSKLRVRLSKSFETSFKYYDPFLRMSFLKSELRLIARSHPSYTMSSKRVHDE